VTTPQEVALIDARKASTMFEKVNVPVLGLIENMSYFISPDSGKRYDIFGSGGGEREAKRLRFRSSARSRSTSRRASPAIGACRLLQKPAIHRWQRRSGRSRDICATRLASNVSRSPGLNRHDRC
jgi:Mrp family chromosome partitioning ATPase